MNKNFLYPLSPLFLFLVLASIGLYLIYSPSLIIPFYHHDVYRFAVGGLDKACQGDYGYQNIYIQARPLNALLDCAHFKIANTLQGMSYLRMSCIFFSSLLAALLANWLMRRVFFSFGLALLASLLVFCMPGIQTAIIMGADPLIFSPLFAFVAYLQVEKGLQKNGHKFLILSGFLCLLMTFFIYPAPSSFFLLPAFILVLFKPLKDWNETRKIALYCSIIFVMACGVYFIAAKIIQHALIVTNYPGGYTVNIPFSLAQLKRMTSFLQIFPELWSIHYDSITQAIIIYVVLLAGIFAAIKKRSAPGFYLVQAIITICFLLLLGSIVYLMQPDNMMFARIFFVFQSMSLFLVLWAITYISEVFHTHKISVTLLMVGILFFIGAIKTNYTVGQSALNDYMEFNYLATELNNHFINNKAIKRIHIVGLKIDSKENFNGLPPRDDIFNVNSTIYRQDSYYMVTAVLNKIANQQHYVLYNCALDEFQLMHKTEKECMAEAPKNSIIVTYSRQKEPVMLTKGILLINMTDDKINFPNKG